MCLSLDLVSDAALIQEYCRMHAPGSVWPAVIEHIRALGVETMEIWQHDDRAFMIMDVLDDYPRRGACRATQQENDRWETYMTTFQKVRSDTDPAEKWLPLRRIFALADHEGISKP
jgi:L-rhamnose mutarotase